MARKNRPKGRARCACPACGRRIKLSTKYKLEPGGLWSWRVYADHGPDEDKCPASGVEVGKWRTRTKA